MTKPEKPKIDIREEVAGFGSSGLTFFWCVITGLLVLMCAGG